MSASLDRIKLIKATIGTIQPGTAVTPTPAQIAAGFDVAKAAINVMISQLVPSWALGMVNITDDEIHVVSDAVAKAVVNTTGGATP